MSAQRYWIDAQGPDAAALGRALAWLYGQLGKGEIGLLAIPAKGNLDGTIESVIGATAKKQLLAGQDVALSSGGHVRLVTERTASKAPVKGCVLVAYGDKKLLDIIDGSPGVTQVLALPWISADVAGWVKTWNAVDLNSVGASALPAASPPSPIKDPVVEQELRGLTQAVNLSTGITHPNDRQRAAEMFNRLAAGGHHLDPADIRSWLVAHGGWQPRDADLVIEVVEKALRKRRQ